MKSMKLAAAASLAAALAAGMSGCDTTPTSYEQARPDVNVIALGDQGLQSKDIIEMSDKMGPDLLKIPEIAASQYKVVIVLKPIENKTADATFDPSIAGMRLRVQLNKNARDRLAFVETRNDTARLQGEEGHVTADPFEDGARVGGGTASTRLEPTYALQGTFQEMRNRQTSYFLCSFRLTNIKTGELVWENAYECRTLRF